MKLELSKENKVVTCRLLLTQSLVDDYLLKRETISLDYYGEMRMMRYHAHVTECGIGFEKHTMVIVQTIHECTTNRGSVFSVIYK